jgi:hypothetical protein
MVSSVESKAHEARRKLTWRPRFGLFQELENGIRFDGGVEEAEGKSYPKFGNFLCNATLSDGSVRANITFSNTQKPGTCAFIIRDNAETGAFLCAGLGGPGVAYTVRAFDGRQWHDIRSVGDFRSIQSDRSYRLAVVVGGGRVELSVDGILLLRTQIPAQLPASQVGLWCQSESAVTVTDFEVESRPPTAFVIMQFTEPYDELYRDVIAPVCLEHGILAVRADETYGPGLILADVVGRIVDSTLIIAEITPVNQNVFYELGYAHALQKPTILIASRAKDLPFDVSGFRTLFYENSIGGKGKIEAELRKHLRAIMSQWSFSASGNGAGSSVERRDVA